MGDSLRKYEHEYHGKFGHTLGWIQHIFIMNRVEIFYTGCRLGTQTVFPAMYWFQGLRRCIQFLANHPHKTILYPSNDYCGSNVIRLTWSRYQLEDYKTHSFLECHQYYDNFIILNRRQSVSRIIHTLLGVAACCKVRIQHAVASDPTVGEIWCLYKAANNTKYVRRYMGSLGLPTGAPTMHWGDNTSFISTVEAKQVTPKFKHINIPVFFLQEQYKNGLFNPEYETNYHHAVWYLH